jgi:ankyrin repeat protein
MAVWSELCITGRMRLGQTLMLITTLGGTLEAQIPDFTPPTPLIAALMHNDTEEAKRLLAKGADPNEGRLLGFSPAFLSVIYQNKAIFDAILAKGVDLQERDPSGATLLMWAAFNDKGSPEIVEELLRRGLDPKDTNKAVKPR